MNAIHQKQIKVIGQNGQLSLGKHYAGQVVSVDYDEEAHVWIIKAGDFVPESQKWLYKGDNLMRLEKALSWAESHETKDNFEQIALEIEKCSK